MAYIPEDDLSYGQQLLLARRGEHDKRETLAKLFNQMDDLLQMRRNMEYVKKGQRQYVFDKKVDGITYEVEGEKKQRKVVKEDNYLDEVQEDLDKTIKAIALLAKQGGYNVVASLAKYYDMKDGNAIFENLENMQNNIQQGDRPTD